MQLCSPTPLQNICFYSFGYFSPIYNYDNLERVDTAGKMHIAISHMVRKSHLGKGFSG
jgi:hypothetical protein